MDAGSVKPEPSMLCCVTALWMEVVEAWECGRFLDLAACAAAESEETKLDGKLNGTQSLRLS